MQQQFLGEQQQKPATETTTSLKARVVISRVDSAPLADVAVVGGGDPPGFPNLGSGAENGVVNGVFATCDTAPGAGKDGDDVGGEYGYGCLAASGGVRDAIDGRGGNGGGDEEASSRCHPRNGTPAVGAGVEAKDLVGLDPEQLIDKVLAGRKAVVDAAERADAAIRAAAAVAVSAAGIAAVVQQDGAAKRLLTGHDDAGDGGNGRRSGVGGGERKQEEVGAVDVVSVDHLSRLLLASAVEDFSSAVGEFSEISRTWVDEVIFVRVCMCCCVYLLTTFASGRTFEGAVCLFCAERKWSPVRNSCLWWCLSIPAREKGCRYCWKNFFPNPTPHPSPRAPTAHASLAVNVAPLFAQGCHRRCRRCPKRR